ncbi:hypothetical protein D3C87_161820 [compost metagenome]
MRFSAGILTLALLLPSLSHAQSGSSWWSGGTDFTKKAVAREQKRWSLSEWMQMKERNRMMDMWLSTNLASPFEFTVAIPYKSFKTEDVSAGTEQSFTSFAGEFSAYAQFVGLTTEYENNTKENYNDLSGMLNIRLLGNSIQNTNLTVSIGQRTRHLKTSTAEVDLKQQFGQASLDLHLTKFFGFEAKYRQYLKTTNDSYGKDIEETLAEAGLFLDFNALRIFGSYYQEQAKMNDPSTLVESKTNRTGIKSGIRIFF